MPKVASSFTSAACSLWPYTGARCINLHTKHRLPCVEGTSESRPTLVAGPRVPQGLRWARGVNLACSDGSEWYSLSCICRLHRLHALVSRDVSFSPISDRIVL